MHKFQLSKGFSIIEMVIVIALVGLLIGVIALSFSKFRHSQALQYSADGVTIFLNEARSRTLANSGGSQYSVKFENDRVVLFSGASYDENDPTNEYMEFSTPVVLGTVSLTGGGSIVSFTRLTGSTNQHGTIELQISGGDSRIITVSSTGAISRN